MRINLVADRLKVPQKSNFERRRLAQCHLLLNQGMPMGIGSLTIVRVMAHSCVKYGKLDCLDLQCGARFSLTSIFALFSTS